MNFIGESGIKIPKTLYNGLDTVDIKLSNMNLSGIVLDPTLTEARCAHCHKTILDASSNLGEEAVVMTPVQVVGANPNTGASRFSITEDSIFLVHIKCLEEFVTTYLNPTNAAPEEPEEESKEDIITGTFQMVK